MGAGAWKNFVFFGVLVAGLLGAKFWFGRSAPMPDVFAGDVRLAEALEQSKETGKPVFALFTADWCGPCQQYKRGSLSESGVASALSDRTIPVYVNIDHEPDDVALMAAMGLSVQYLPTSVVISGGEVTSTAVGPQSSSAVLAMIKAGEEG